MSPILEKIAQYSYHYTQLKTREGCLDMAIQITHAFYEVNSDFLLKRDFRVTVIDVIKDYIHAVVKELERHPDRKEVTQIRTYEGLLRLAELALEDAALQHNTIETVPKIREYIYLARNYLYKALQKELVLKDSIDSNK
jgi:hypothetical protein